MNIFQEFLLEAQVARGLNTIQFYIILKLEAVHGYVYDSLNTIQFYIILKPVIPFPQRQYA